jgi:phenylpropionate dioxygenase-like ring-hydroxylating dioxygenase large terminal subunit
MSELLRDIWYFAALSRELRPGRLMRKMVLGEPVLFGRTRAGEAFALRDICPHRAAPLSAGRIIDHAGAPAVECPYHGWMFRTDGACAGIPSLVEGQDFDAARIRLARHPLAEQAGLVWIYMAADARRAAAPATPPPDFADLAVGGRPKLVDRTVFDTHIDHAVVGLMDPAHGPYVHAHWWWRRRHDLRAKEKRFEPRPMGFSMVRHKPSGNSYAYAILGGAPQTEITFRLPGVRWEDIRAGATRVLALTCLTPLDETRTEITQTFYWNNPLLSLAKPVIAAAARAFLRQDGAMVNLQKQGLRFDPALIWIDDSDTQAKWYQRLKKEWIAARAESRDFVNPLTAATLRWRS